MKSATAMKSAATVESTAAANRRPAMEATNRSTRRVTMSDRPSAIEPRMTIVAVAVESRVTPVVVVIPGAGTDEGAADEPVRPVVAVRRACVGVIRVVAVGAGWFHTDGHGSDTHANSYANLRLGRLRGNHQGNGEHCHRTKNFCVSHLRLLVSFPNLFLPEAHLTARIHCRGY